MAKTVIKEAFIIILLCVAIALVLAVVFYDYVPINKTVPQPVVYSMPEELSEVQEELNNSVTGSSEKVVLTYEIDEADLVGYMQTKVYDAGKADPFSVYAEEPRNTTVDNGNTNDSNNNVSNTNTNSSSSGTLFEKGNIK